MKIIKISLLIGALGCCAQSFSLDQHSQLIKKISKAEKKFTKRHGRRYSFQKYARPETKGALKKQRFQINELVHPQNCRLGVKVSILDKENNEISSQALPIDLTTVSSDNLLLDKGVWGHSLTFSNQQLSLYYPRKIKAKRVRKKILALANLCNQLPKEQQKSISQKDHEDNKTPTVPQSDDIFARPIREYDEHFPTTVAPLTNGHEALAGRIQLNQFVHGPKSSNLILTHIFMADEVGQLMANSWIEQAKSGARVAVVIDAQSPFLDVRNKVIRRNTPRMYHNMMAAGIPVYGYKCSTLGKRLKDEIKLSAHFRRIGPLYHRPHEKVQIVNGEWAIMGGMNITNRYFRVNEDGKDYWRDQDLLIHVENINTVSPLERHDLIQDLINVFEGVILTNNNNHLDPKQDTCFNPYHPIDEKESYLQFLNENTLTYDPFKKGDAREEVKAHALAKIEEIKEKALNKHPDFTFAMTPLQEGRIIQNRPKIKETLIEESYLELINKAKKEILISNAYFIPTPTMSKALQDACARGVKVTILTNAMRTNDLPAVAALTNYTLRPLVEPTILAGNPIEIYFWDGLYRGERSLNLAKEQGTNHAKFMVVDKKISVVGSYNIDPRSRDINSELVLIMDQKEMSRKLREEVLTIDVLYSKKLEYADIIEEHTPPKIKDIISLKMKGYFPDESIKSLVKKRVIHDLAQKTDFFW